jgi:hypothetical protein
VAKARTYSVAVAYIFAKITTLKFITLRQNKLECFVEEKKFYNLDRQEGHGQERKRTPSSWTPGGNDIIFLLSLMISDKARKNKLKLI